MSNLSIRIILKVFEKRSFKVVNDIMMNLIVLNKSVS